MSICCIQILTIVLKIAEITATSLIFLLRETDVAVFRNIPLATLVVRNVSEAKRRLSFNFLICVWHPAKDIEATQIDKNKEKCEKAAVKRVCHTSMCLT